jgi:hypothetical protein
MPQAVLCHHCRQKKVSVHGGDICCSEGCRVEMAKTHAAAEKELQTKGFVKVQGILNLWEKDGRRISLAKVIRHGVHALA